VPPLLRGAHFGVPAKRVHLLRRAGARAAQLLRPACLAQYLSRKVNTSCSQSSTRR
jgi:hypothetical protein